MENLLDVLTILNVNTLRNKESIKKGQGHVCPINTRIVNNHIYKHTYQPRYSCCEENTVTNEQCGSCCQFR